MSNPNKAASRSTPVRAASNAGRFGENADDEAVCLPTQIGLSTVRKPKLPHSELHSEKLRNHDEAMSVPSLKEPPAYSVERNAYQNLNPQRDFMKPPSQDNSPSNVVGNGKERFNNRPNMDVKPKLPVSSPATVPGAQRVTGPDLVSSCKSSVPGATRVMGPYLVSSGKSSLAGATRVTGPDLVSSCKVGLTESRDIRVAGPSSDSEPNLSVSSPTVPGATRVTGPDLVSSRKVGLTESRAIRVAGPSSEAYDNDDESLLTARTQSDKPGAMRMGVPSAPTTRESLGTQWSTNQNSARNEPPSMEAPMEAPVTHENATIVAELAEDVEIRLQKTVEERIKEERENQLIAEAVEFPTCFGIHRWLFITIVVCSIIILGIGLGLGLKVGKGAPIEQPTASPTIFVTPRFDKLLQRIGPNVTDDMDLFENRTTLQYKTMYWLANVDTYDPEDGRPFKETSLDQIYIERYVLAFIYFSMNGKNWQEDVNFLTNVSVCEWHDQGLVGAVCTDGDYVTELYLPNIGIEGFLGPEIGLLRSLVLLNFDNGAIGGTIPEEFYELTNLVHLSLHNCALTGSISSAIGKMTDLNYMDIYDSNLDGILPTEIGLLTRLTLITLWDDDFISGPIPTELGKLTNLTFLDFGSNKFTGTIPSEIGLLTELTILRLNTNLLKGVLPTQLGLLTNLIELNLRLDLFTGTVPSELQDLKKLNLLFLDGTSITGSVDDIFCGSGASPLTQFWADCAEDPPQLECSSTCCTKCCPEGLDCTYVPDTTVLATGSPTANETNLATASRNTNGNWTGR